MTWKYIIAKLSTFWNETYVAHSSQAVTMNAEDNLTCSENGDYDSASSTVEMSSQAKVTCSENIAYSTIKEANENSTRSTNTSYTAVYDEVTLR